ncbi:hypothetical protein IWX49DRAFT_65756 [Phyllosticta citricarpa]
MRGERHSSLRLQIRRHPAISSPFYPPPEREILFHRHESRPSIGRRATVALQLTASSFYSAEHPRGRKRESIWRSRRACCPKLLATLPLRALLLFCVQNLMTEKPASHQPCSCPIQGHGLLPPEVDLPNNRPTSALQKVRLGQEQSQLPPLFTCLLTEKLTTRTKAT